MIPRKVNYDILNDPQGIDMPQNKQNTQTNNTILIQNDQQYILSVMEGIQIHSKNIFAEAIKLCSKYLDFGIK